jgi:glycosyltransferase involved in cell wall biosynthesis
VVREPTAAQSQLPHYFLVSYHALPSSAVGALRLSALAEYLVARNILVTLFSAKTLEPPLGRDLDERIHRYVIEDNKTWTRWVLRAVRTLRSLRERSAATTTGHVVREERIDIEQGVVARLRRSYLKLEGAVDSEKLWSIKLFFALLWSLARRRPVGLIASGPPFSPLLAATAACWIMRTPLVLDFRDPWRERLLTEEYRGFHERVDAFFESWCVRRARSITTTAPTLAADFARRYGRRRQEVVCIMNGFDDDMVVEDPPPVGTLQLLFAGTIYLNRSPMPLLEAMIELLSQPGVDRDKVKLTLVGQCARWRDVDLAEWAKVHGVTDCIDVRGFESRMVVAQLIRQANVLVNFSQGQKRQIPAKLFEHLAARRTVLLFAEPDSDVATTFQGQQGVYRLDDSVTSTLSCLRALYEMYVVTRRLSPSAVTAAVPEFSRQETSRRLAFVLEAVGSSESAGASDE